jgi:thiamine kinase-like enzyme
LNHGDSLLVAGAHDLRVSRLLSILEPFFQFIADSTRRLPLQTSKNLTLLEVSELKDIVRLTLQELDGLRLFDTVGHMDLSPANIFGSTGRAVFLDWAEAFVGDPLFSFEYLLQHFRRKFSRDAPLEERFRNAYLKAWRAKIPPKHLERALLLSPLSALFGYAATIWASAQADSAQLPSRERYLLSLVRKMKDEVPQMEAGRGLR